MIAGANAQFQDCDLEISVMENHGVVGDSLRILAHTRNAGGGFAHYSFVLTRSQLIALSNAIDAYLLEVGDDVRELHCPDKVMVKTPPL